MHPNPTSLAVDGRAHTQRGYTTKHKPKTLCAVQANQRIGEYHIIGVSKPPALRYTTPKCRAWYRSASQSTKQNAYERKQNLQKVPTGHEIRSSGDHTTE
jgi:hypothetical protein